MRERTGRQGHIFPADTEWMKRVRRRLRIQRDRRPGQAIADVKRDMESQLPMDRLLCGDVGYGKTEVAMRAAFKAISDNKQVAVLAPTTVLAFQHYETFKQRFAPFPITVDMISRFRTQAASKKFCKE
jgi:transcription-repair coupling factor (superfamily II helicase)